MDFELTEEEKDIRRAAREFAEGEINPRVEEIEEEEKTPRDLVEKMKDLGFFGIQYPEKYGGGGGNYREYAIALEEISKEYCSMGVVISVHNLCAGTIYENGTEEQKEEFLPPLLEGDKIGSYGFTEPATGSYPPAIEAKAVPDGDEFVINGRKMFSTNAPLDGTYIVFAKDKTYEDGNRISVFIVPKDSEGYEAVRVEDTMGMKGIEAAEVTLDDVRVPKSNLIGGEEGRGDGYNMLLDIISTGQLAISAESIGIIEKALEISVEYANERTQRGQPIGNFQTIQWMIAEIVLCLESARWLTYRTAYLKDKGSKIRTESSIAKMYATRASVKAADLAMQVHGAYGYTTDYPAERLFRDAKLGKIYEVVNEVHRVLIAGDYLRRY